MRIWNFMQDMASGAAAYLPTMGMPAMHAYDPTEALKRALNEAYVMVHFASEHGKTVDAQHLTAVHNLRRALEQAGKAEPGEGDGAPASPPPTIPKPETEAAFWGAYEKLSTIIAPASVESIMMTRGLCNNLYDDIETASPATRRIRFYKVLTTAVFLLILLIQAFWFIGQVIVSDINTNDKSLDAAQLELDALQADIEKAKILADHGVYPTDFTNQPGFSPRTGGSNAPSGAPALAEDAKDFIDASHRKQLYDLEDRFENHSDWQDAAYVNLKYWNRVWAAAVPFVRFSFETAEYAGLKPIPQRRIEFEAGRTALKTIGGLVLPMLFALLGSAVYVIRRISQHIQENDLSGSTLVRMSSRLLMGMVAGVALSWLVMPGGGFFHAPGLGGGSENAAALAQGLDLLKNLGPWMSAFVAGYAVEIFFSLLDNLVGAFVKSKTAAKA